MKKIISTNPGKGYEVIGEVIASTRDEIVTAVAQAKAAEENWHLIGQAARNKYISKLCSLFEANADRIQEMSSMEVGKTRADAKFRFEGGISLIRWLIENSEQILKPEITHEDANSLHKIYYEPYGTVAVITPWNHPFQMFIWGVIPNLLVGNTVVVKHSEECPLTGQLLDELIKEVGLPEGVYAQIFGDREEGKILTDQAVDMIWFTGSTSAGQDIFAKAGKKFVKSVLELGGSNANIIFEDVDVTEHLDKIFFKRFGNCGQSCDALKRLLVHESIVDDTLELLKNFVENKKFGSNAEAETEIGPLAAKRQAVLLQSQIDDALGKGAKIITGGKISDKLDGAYFEPTIITNLNDSMRIWSEEVFGPSLSVIPFKTEAEAIEIANCTEYGLGAVVFSKDLDRAKRVAKKLKAGTVEINEASHWHHNNPFGGYKKSGMGREHGVTGLRELCQVKVISETK
ncbi:MAG: aldehyde dehydrogenase family protein [Bdellovibrionota bacterium]